MLKCRQTASAKPFSRQRQQTPPVARSSVQYAAAKPQVAGTAQSRHRTPAAATNRSGTEGTAATVLVSSAELVGVG